MKEKNSENSMELLLRKARLGKRFFLLFLLLSMIPLLTIGGLTYARASDLTEKQAGKYCLQIIKGIQTNFDFLFNQIDDFTVSVAYSPIFQSRILEFRTQEDVYRSSNDIMDYLQRNIILNRQSIVRTSLMVFKGDKPIYEDGVFFDTDYLEHKNVGVLISGDIFENAMEHEGMLVWNEVLSPHYAGYAYGNIGNGFQVTRTFSSIKQGVKSVGVLSMMYTSDYFDSTYKNLVAEGNVYLLDNNGNILFTNKKDLLYKQFPYEDVVSFNGDSLAEEPLLVMADNGLTILAASASKVTGWRIVFATPFSPLVEDKLTFAIYTLTIVFVMLILSALAAGIVASSVYRPVRRLISVTQAVQSGNFDVRDNVSGNDEITALSTAFNEMIKKIKDLIDEIIASNKRERDFKLQALQAQINPHFLYNALDGIRWTARKNKDYEASKRIEILSSLFRIVLSNNDVFTSIEKEVQYTRYYLFFQEQGFKGQLKVVWNIDDSVLPYNTVKLLLQPIVENCIIHAMRPTGELLTITISLKDLGEHIMIRIQDDGVGFDDSVAKMIMIMPEHDNGHIAIRNVNDRIKEYYGDEYGLTFHSLQNTGTVVEIKIPKR